MRTLLLLACLAVASSCTCDPGALEDAGSSGGGRAGGGRSDAGVRDGGAGDAGPSDAGFDGAPGDAGLDGGQEDAGPIDAGPCARAMAGAPPFDPFRRERSTADQPDDEPGAFQVHVLYVEPADVTAPVQLDTTGAIRRSVTAFNELVAARLGGRRLRFDTCDGRLDVTFVKLPMPYTELSLAEGTTMTPAGPERLRDRLETLVRAQFPEPNKLFLLVWDGIDFGHCGGGPHPPELLGRVTALFVGGVFQSSFVTDSADAGATTVTLFDPARLPLPATPFDATLGGQAVRVTSLVGAQASFTPAIAAPIAQGAALISNSTIPRCRSNPFSSDGRQLNYWEYSGAHEVLHALGIVSAAAPHHAPPPIALGHLGLSGPSGTADLMYQGSMNWGCLTGQPHASAATSPCVLDPTHQNYVEVPPGSGLADLAASAFLTPSPPDGGVLPAGW